LSAPITPPIDLTLPQPGSTTARGVMSRAIGALLGDLRHVMRRPVDDPRVRRDIAALAAALARVPDRESALMSMLRRPNVGALIRCARLPAADPLLVPELIATLAVELAVLGALRSNVTLECLPSRVVSLMGRFALDMPGAKSMTVAPDAIVIGPSRITLPEPLAGEHAGVVVRRPYHAITEKIELALEDNNPLSMYEAHPRKSGNRVDLGEREASEWCRSLRDALDRIERYLPDLRAEHDLFVQQFVPVGFDAEAHLSASYREAIGTVYLTLHPQPMTMTEAVIHEFSHNKINALFETDPLLHNAYSPLYKSPARPDPRPLHGVLLAVHAFVPVARLYEAMREENDPLTQHPSFDSRFRQIVAGNHQGIEVLSRHAEPTPAGRAVLDELVRLDRHFTS
jgi:HEXXH motif-containing protein